MPVEDILACLDKVKPNGKRKWVACCPAHEDSDPSLSITEVQDGRILLYCFAGCGAADVVNSLGLSLSDLFPDGGLKTHMYGGTPGYRKSVVKKESDLESARLMLRLCQKRREAGERVCPSDLAAEREAFLLLRSA